jgi:hypothetical protein
MKFDGILFGAVILLSVASAVGDPPEEKANALAKIFSEPSLWGKDYRAGLASLPAWNRLGEKKVMVFADRVVGGSPQKTREEAQTQAEKFTETAKALRPKPNPRFEALFKARGGQPGPLKMEVIPSFPDDDSVHLATAGQALQFLPAQLALATVKERLGPPEKISTEVIQGKGDRRPIILTLHTYAGGAVVFAESDMAPRPGSVNRVILDVPTVTAALFKEER